MRIAIYYSVHSGGAKRTIFEQVKRLSARHHVDLFSLSSAAHKFCDARPYVKESLIYMFEPWPLFGSPLRRLNQATRTLDLVRLRQVAGRMAADIDARGYDVVLVHPCRYTQSPWLLHFVSTPTAYYCQEPLRMLYEGRPSRPYAQRTRRQQALNTIDLTEKVYRRVLRRIDQGSLRKATSVLTNSHFTRAAIGQIYGVEAKVCYHGVDAGLFRPLELSGSGAVLSVGALTALKGFDCVIEGLGTVPAKRRPKLIIVSNYQEPNERAYLERLAKHRGVETFFHTMVDDQELVKLYSQAALTVYAPIQEPFGMVPLESMACGTPVVAVREGGVRETVVDGQTGILVDRDPEELGRAIRTVLEDDDLAKRYGAQGRAYVAEKWTWEQASQRLERNLMSVATGATECPHLAKSWGGLEP